MIYMSECFAFLPHFMTPLINPGTTTFGITANNVAERVVFSMCRW